MHGTLPTRAPTQIPSWTEESMARLKQLNADGYTASQIAAALNKDFRMRLTRNAVLGKVHRMGIQFERGQNVTPDTRIEQIKRLDQEGLSRRQIMISVGCRYGLISHVLGKLPEDEAKARRSKGLIESHKRPDRPWLKGVEKLEKVTGFVPESRPVTLADLDFVKACRWPVGEPSSADFRYCGADKIEGHSYCGAHCRSAYTFARKPREDKRPVYRTEQAFRRFA